MLIYSDCYLNDLKIARGGIVNIEQLQNKRILITGATGLIGSAIVDLLMDINEEFDYKIVIYAAGRNEDKFKQRFSRYSHNDLLHFFHYNAFKQINSNTYFEYIIHAASNANPRAYVEEPVETMMANFMGVYYALEYANCKRHTRVLFISSSEVYGKKKNTLPYIETDYGYVDVLNFRSCYPSSKRAAETLIASYIKEYNVNAVIVRPGHVYGPTATPKDTRASSQFPRDVIEDHDIVMKSAGTQVRSYCYVLDCVSAILTVLLNGKNGDAYNISNKDSVCSIRAMAEAFAMAGDKKVVFENPSDEERSGYNLMDNSSLNSEKLEGLGWKAYFDIKTGTLHTLKSFR